MFHTKFVERIKTDISSSLNSFPENRTMYEIMWISMLRPDRPKMTI